MRAGRWRQPGARDLREIDAGLLEHRAALHHARAAAAAFGALPRVLDEAAATVGGFEALADSILQALKEGPHALDRRRGISRDRGIAHAQVMLAGRPRHASGPPCR